MYDVFPDAEGALLGNMDVDKADIKFQFDFMTKCTSFLNGNQNCLELAAGPLRVTLGCLSYFFKVIDINDIVPNLTRVWQNLEPEFTSGKVGKRKRKGALGERFVCDMTDLAFNKKYNLIYGNWCFNYLSNAEILTLLGKARKSLISGKLKPGTIILKENIRDYEDKETKIEN